MRGEEVGGRREEGKGRGTSLSWKKRRRGKREEGEEREGGS